MKSDEQKTMAWDDMRGVEGGREEVGRGDQHFFWSSSFQ